MPDPAAATALDSEPSVLRRAGPLVLARLATAIIGIATPLILARVMSLPDYGSYKQLFLIAQSLHYVFSFGVSQSLYFFIPRTEQRRAFYGQTALIMAFAGLLAGGAVAAFGPQVATLFSNPGLLDHQAALTLYVAGTLGSAALEIGLTAQGRMVSAAKTYLASDLVRSAALVVPVLAGSGIGGMMWAMAAFAAARWAATLGLLVVKGRGPLVRRPLLGQQLRYAAPFGAAVVASTIQQYAHQFAVSSAFSPAQFAIYSVACFQLPLVDLLYSPVSEVLMVELGEDERHGRTSRGLEAFRQASATLAYAFFPLAAFLFSAAPEFIGALFGAKFLDAVPLFRAGLVGIVLSANPVDGALRARNQTRHIFLAYLLKAVVTVPLVIVGVRVFGMMGGMLSWSIAECLGFVALTAKLPAVFSPSGQRIGLARIMPWRELGKASLAAMAAGGGVWVLRLVMDHSLPALPDGLPWRMVPLGVVALGYAGAYFAVLRLAGVDPLGLLSAFRRRA